MATASRLAWRPHARQTGVPIRPTSNHLGGRAVVAGFVLRHKTTRMNRPARCSACRPVFAATKAEDGVGGCEIGSNGRGVSSRSSRSQPPRVPVVTTAAEQEEKHDRKHDKGCERHDCLQLNRGAISGPQVCRDESGRRRSRLLDGATLAAFGEQRCVMRFRKLLFLLVCATSATACWGWHDHGGYRGYRHDRYAQRR
jgi:hypothetical protein